MGNQFLFLFIPFLFGLHCSGGKGVGSAAWHLSIINSLFSQLVLISQLARRHSAHIFRAGSGLGVD